MLRQAHARGLADRAGQRARAALAIDSDCRHEHGRTVWYWSLPGAVDPAQLRERQWEQQAANLRQAPPPRPGKLPPRMGS